MCRGHDHQQVLQLLLHNCHRNRLHLACSGDRLDGRIHLHPEPSWSQGDVDRAFRLDHINDLLGRQEGWIVLSRPPRESLGFTLIEAMVALVIAGVLLAVAAPSFSNWIASTRVRSTAEAMLAGLQYAKSEATTRNAQIRFQLTSSLDNTCLLTTTGANWVVDVVDAVAKDDSVEGKCDLAPSDTVAPSILQTRSARETGTSTRVAADQSAVVFNGLGRVVPAPPAAISIDFDNGTKADCAIAGGGGGPLTCLRIVISTAGQIRMCNPAAAAGQPQAC
jgi:type IV fimbrial biogenesis protein FimT